MELKPIPGTLGFLADSEGNIYEPTFMVRRATYRNADGYITSCVYTTDEKWVTFGVHRLVCMAFHGMPQEGFDHVNHRDCNIENNRASNLEWVSVEQNNIHSEIMRRGNLRACIYANHREAGVHQLYMNAWDAADHSGVEALDIWDAIKTGSEIDGWCFFYQRYSANIPKEVQKPRMPEKKGVQALEPKPIKIRLIDSEIDDGAEVFRFSSIAEAARFFNVGTSAIHQAIPKSEVVRVFQKKYQIAYEDQEFQKLSEEDREKAKNTGSRDVVAYYYPENRIYFFESGVAFLEHSKLSKKAVTTALAKNQLRKIDDWVALYFEDGAVDRLLNFVKGSSPNIIYF